MLPILLPFVIPVILASPAGPNETDEASIMTELDLIRSEITDYRQEQNTQQISAQRADYIRSIITDVLADSEMRTSLRQKVAEDFSSDWNELKTPDEQFTMLVNYYMQTDWIYNKTESENAEYGMEIQRARLTFSGNVINESIQYYSRLDLAGGGLGVEAAYLQLNFCENWSLQGGLIYSIFCLEENISNDRELGVSLSFVSGQFDQETEAGLVLAWQGESARFWATYSNGFGQSDINPLTNTRQGFMFRLGYKPFGNWDTLYDFNPHPGTTEPGILLGIAATHDWGTYNDPTNTSSPSATGPATRASADVTWQMPGFSIMNAAYFQDWSQGGEDWSQGGARGGTRWAAVSQVTGFLTPEFQLYGRYEWGRIMDSGQKDVSIATVGMSYYPFKIRVIKYSLEFLYSFGATTNWLMDGDPGIQLTNEPQAIIRSQLQITF